MTSILALSTLALATPFASASVRTHAYVWWVARGLRSDDPAVRRDTRLRLHETGLDGTAAIYPELVASEVADEVDEDPESVVVVAGMSRSGPAHYLLEAVLRPRVGRVEAALDPTGVLGVGPRKLLVFAPSEIQGRRDLAAEVALADQSRHLLSIPLDDDGPAIIEAVQKRLARLERLMKQRRL